MKLALLGYGKMGKAIAALAEAAGDEVVLRIGSGNISELTIEALQQADVAVEVSRPETAFDHITLCLEAGVPVVCGTTGWLDRLEEAVALCTDKEGALLYASNFSIGVNLFFALNKRLAELMGRQPQYDPSILEIHHTQKLDEPSGTAISLAQDILDRLSRKSNWVLTNLLDIRSSQIIRFTKPPRFSKPGNLSNLSNPIEPGEPAVGVPDELPITSIREGQVPGTHEVVYRSDIDTISIRHEAHSREGFARGALLAAHWIAGKKGFFSMSDVLEI
ncbi:MAG: 4-hydroxy-tetrahydrodipicolinate reductase [Saprospiraceae bacterium]|nr:4-hydroxy-tetrahydrodipicolinate reductase [Saprospiraceae bacterium]